jgi:hypothetical protein
LLSPNIYRPWFIDPIEERMRELSVSTQTTPVELATMFNSLAPDDEIGGKPGADGAVILYVCGDRRSPMRDASGQVAITARVAIDVVLQHVDGMPGAQPLVDNVREQLAGIDIAKAGWLAPPLTVLARLYIKTVSAMPGSPEPGRMPPHQGCADSDDDAAEQALLTPEQRQAMENLIDRLMALSMPSRQPNRQ